VTIEAAPPRRSAGAARQGVVHDIAERRRRDVLDEVEATSLGAQLDAALASPAPRPVAERLAAPGLHLIAEIKRASPSAGRIASGAEDIVARARAYETGGAAAISVLCEPHWFGGSLDDLRAIRGAVSIPVLAKEFVVEDIQLPMLRSAGADLVLLLAVLHSPKRLARLVERALAIGLEPVVEAHDERELRSALATDARLIGLNNRDLRTLDVDPTRADRLRTLVPDDRLVIAESGVKDAATVARWRALGFDGALVGEALMRSSDAVAAVRSFVDAGRAPDDPANVARRPFVKICGVTDADGVLAAVRSGADALGLNFAPASPRCLSLSEGAELARLVRLTAPPERHPRVVAVVGAATSPRADLAGVAIAVELADGAHRGAIGRAPLEGGSQLVGPVVEAAPEDEGLDPESPQDLWQLGDVAEWVGQVADRHRLATVATGHLATGQEVANQGLAPGEELVGEDVPRAHRDPAGPDQGVEPLDALRRTDLRIVVQDDGLPVQGEGAEGGIGLHGLDDLVDRPPQAHAEDLEGQVPLAVPVGVGHHGPGEVGGTDPRRGRGG